MHILCLYVRGSLSRLAPHRLSCLQLTSLAVNDNNLSGAALTALAPLTKLRRLDVAGGWGQRSVRGGWARVSLFLPAARSGEAGWVCEC